MEKRKRGWCDKGAPRGIAKGRERERRLSEREFGRREVEKSAGSGREFRGRIIVLVGVEVGGGGVMKEVVKGIPVLSVVSPVLEGLEGAMVEITAGNVHLVGAKHEAAEFTSFTARKLGLERETGWGMELRRTAENHVVTRKGRRVNLGHVERGAGKTHVADGIV